MPIKFMMFIILLWTTSLNANPSPLGIELNKSTLEDVKKSYRILNSELNATKGYRNNFLDIKNIKIDTLSLLGVVSNEDNIIEAVSLVLDKKKFNEINQALSEKYKVITSDTPSVGDKIVIFEDGDCLIINHAPHMSFTMFLLYTTKSFENKNYARFDKEKKEKKAQTKNML